MASAGFTFVCAAPADTGVLCPLSFPAGATVAVAEACYPGPYCAAVGFVAAGGGLYCSGYDFNSGLPASGECNVQFAGPIPDVMTTSDALEVGWSILLVWALAWGVRRLLSYAAAEGRALD